MLTPALCWADQLGALGEAHGGKRLLKWNQDAKFGSLREKDIEVIVEHAQSLVGYRS